MQSQACCLRKVYSNHGRQVLKEHQAYFTGPLLSYCVPHLHDLYQQVFVSVHLFSVQQMLFIPSAWTSRVPAESGNFDQELGLASTLSGRRSPRMHML